MAALIHDVYRPNSHLSTELWKMAIDSLSSVSTVAQIIADLNHLAPEEKILAEALLREAATCAAALKQLRILNANSVSTFS
jgi:hypothetical protein